MQLNEVHNPHEHASVSLKVILLVFAVILIGTLGYLVWDYQNTPSAGNESTVKVTKSDNTKEEESTTNTVTAPTAAGGFTFDLPAGYGAYYQSECEGGCVYLYKIGKLNSKNEAVVDQQSTVITVSSRVLTDEQTTLEDFNEADILTDLTKLGETTVDGVTATEYSQDGLNEIYHVRFIKDGKGYSLLAYSSGSVTQTKANEVVKKILSSWSF